MHHGGLTACVTCDLYSPRVGVWAGLELPKGQETMQAHTDQPARRAAGAAPCVPTVGRLATLRALPALGAWDHPNRIEAHELRELGLSAARCGFTF